MAATPSVSPWKCLGGRLGDEACALAALEKGWCAMREKCTVAWLLAISAVVSIRETATAQGEQGRDSQHAVSRQVHAQVWALVGAKGAAYTELRDGLIPRAEASRPFLESLTRSRSHWETRLMAGILLERLDHPMEVEQAIQWSQNMKVPRDIGVKLSQLPAAIAARCASTPLLLVEKIWKGNDFARGTVPAHEQGTWEAEALGLLGEKRAVEPLIAMLRRPPEDDARLTRVWTAARALGKLGDPRALPALCQAFVLYRGRHDVARAASLAIEGMVRPETCSVLVDCARRLGESEARDDLLRVARRLGRE